MSPYVAPWGSRATDHVSMAKFSDRELSHAYVIRGPAGAVDGQPGSQLRHGHPALVFELASPYRAFHHLSAAATALARKRVSSVAAYCM